MSDKIISQALKLWGIEDASFTLIAARENVVYHVKTQTKQFALRLHRQGYRNDNELTCELEWMAAASRGGMHVPSPIRSMSNDFMHIIDGTQIDLLNWLSGTPLSETIHSFDTAKRCEIFGNIGIEMARLHKISDAWERPDGFIRCAWDRDGLLGKSPLWDRFWENPGLSTDEQNLFLAMREKANAELSLLEGHLDYGLIHADMVAANVLYDGENIQIIDFDDGGFGFRLFDIATTLVKFLDNEDIAELRKALIDGYLEVKDIDVTHLDLFLLLRAATYVGWNITRMEEMDGMTRNSRFIHTTRILAENYLENYVT